MVAGVERDDAQLLLFEQAHFGHEMCGRVFGLEDAPGLMRCCDEA